MRRLAVDLDWGRGDVRQVGTLAEVDGRILFEYDAAFLAAPLPLSPFRLPVAAGVFEDRERTFSGLFGLFEDSLPDGWGRLLMDRAFERIGRARHRVTPLDRLAYVSTRAPGALTYRPAANAPTDDTAELDLSTLAHEAERVASGGAGAVLAALHLVGGSPGGARPKVAVWVGPSDQLVAGVHVVPDGYAPYLVKFRSPDDERWLGRVEDAYANMARAAGLDLPETRTFELDDGEVVFATRRFDRGVGGTRVHMHSLAGLLHADHRSPSLGYESFLRATRALTRDESMVVEALRRAAFNVVAHNRDDHTKNQAFLMDRSGRWRLAPAFDLVPSTGVNGWHSMDVAGAARDVGPGDVLRLAAASGIDARTGRAVVEQVVDTVAAWPSFARAAGVPHTAARDVARLHQLRDAPS